MGYGDRLESTDTQTIVGAFGGGLGSSTFDDQVFMSDDGKPNFGVVSGTPHTLSSTKTYNADSWHHVVDSLGAAGTKLVVDGHPVADDAGVTSSSQSFRAVWHVGFDRAAAAQRGAFTPGGPPPTTTYTPFWSVMPTSFYFNGTIDDTAVYPTQLSDAAVAGHYGGAGYSTSDATPSTPPPAPARP